MNFQNDQHLLEIIHWKSSKCVDVKLLDYSDLKPIGLISITNSKIDLFFIATFEDQNTKNRDSMILKVIQIHEKNEEYKEKIISKRWKFTSVNGIANILDKTNTSSVLYLLQVQITKHAEWLLTHLGLSSFKTPNSNSVGDIGNAFKMNMDEMYPEIGDKRPIKFRVWNPYEIKYTYINTAQYIQTKDYWVFVTNDLYLLNRKIQKHKISSLNNKI
eukprot:242422_1